MASSIFDHILSQLDNNDLFSALQVNRYWCSLAIPRLWNDPFSISHLVEDQCTVRRQQERLISTCFAFMPIETKHHLGILGSSSRRTRKLLSKLARLIPKKLRSKSALVFQRHGMVWPKFQYLSLIRVLRLEDLANALWSWFNAHLAFHSTDSFWPICSALWELVIERNQFLEHVSIDISVDRPKRPSFDLLMLNFREEQESLQRIVQSVFSHNHLQSLVLSEVPDTLYVLQVISKTFIELKHLTILESDNYIVADELVTIIYALNELCSFKLTRCNIPTRENDDLSDLIHALGTRDSLTEIILVGGVIKDISVLTSLLNLDHLKILRLEDNITTTERLPLSLFRFPTIKDLTLVPKKCTALEPPNDFCSRIFQVNGIQLTRLELILSPQMSNYAEIILSISVNCASLRKLTLRISTNDEAKALLSVFEHCPHLHSLNIPEQTQPLIVDTLFLNLASKFPGALKKLRLRGWILSQRVLVKFFEQCNATFDFLEIKLKDTDGESDDIILSSLMHDRSFKKFDITLLSGNEWNVMFYFQDPIYYKRFLW